MAKTTRPIKQLELPIMVDMNLRAERQTARPALNIDEAPARQAVLRRHVAEASSVDLSVYDAISSNYVRGSK
jgi:hypothetical protein